MDGVERVFGFHVMNGPVGTIGIPKGVATSSAGGWTLTIQGIGGHGSMPHRATDPVICAAHCVVALNTIVSRNVSPSDFCVVNVGLLHAGEASNIIPDQATIGCSIRTYSADAAEIAYRRCEEIIAGVCAAFGCTYELTTVSPYPIVYNDHELVDACLASARQVLGGDDWAAECPPTTASEDFSEFTSMAPGVFVFVNAGDESDGLPYQNHHPKFGIVEDPTLFHGVAVEVQIVLDQLAG